MMKLFRSIVFRRELLVILVASIGAALVLNAWTDPQSAPPAGNVSAPAVLDPPIVGYLYNNSSVGGADCNTIWGVLAEIPKRSSYTKYRAGVQTLSGNMHAAIYSLDGATRYWVQNNVPATSNYMIITMSPTVTLNPGKYWLVVAADNAMLRWYNGEFGVHSSGFRQVLAGACSGLPTSIASVVGGNPLSNYTNQPVTQAISTF